MLGCPSPSNAIPQQTQRHPAAPGHLETPRGPSRLVSSQRPTARSVCGGVRQEEHALTSREVSISCSPTRTHVMQRRTVLDHNALERAATCVQTPRTRCGCGWCRGFSPAPMPSGHWPQPVRCRVIGPRHICASRARGRGGFSQPEGRRERTEAHPANPEEGERTWPLSYAFRPPCRSSPSSRVQSKRQGQRSKTCWMSWDGISPGSETNGVMSGERCGSS